MKNFHKVSIAFISLLALSTSFVSAPAFADGECLEWNVTGSWPLTQSNGTRVILRLQQTGTHLQGVGEYSYHSDSAEQQYTVSGPVDGQLENGNRVRVAAYWSNGSVGLYVGEIQADGGMSGYTSDRNNVNNKATFVASASAQCVSRAAVSPPKPTMALGRVQTPAGTPAAPPMTMCERAAAARARNSPSAPSLERQCAAQGEKPPAAPAAAAPTVVKEDHSYLADVFGSAPAAQPAEEKAVRPPVEAPHDLRVESITFSQNNKLVTRAVLGETVEIRCKYRAIEVASPFASRILEWRGYLLREGLGMVGGENWGFYGTTPGGPYWETVFWKPNFFGKWTFRCSLNRDFAYAEANPDNNEVTAVLDVIEPAPPPPPSQ